jgi:hypothetical protein
MLEHDDVCTLIDLNLRRSGKLVFHDFTIGKGWRAYLSNRPQDDSLGVIA